MKSETNSKDQKLNDQNKNESSKQFGAFVLNFEHSNFVFFQVTAELAMDMEVENSGSLEGLENKKRDRRKLKAPFIFSSVDFPLNFL